MEDRTPLEDLPQNKPSPRWATIFFCVLIVYGSVFGLVLAVMAWLGSAELNVDAIRRSVILLFGVVVPVHTLLLKKTMSGEWPKHWGWLADVIGMGMLVGALAVCLL